ncbi:mannose-6-phosphate isomerase-like protein (cupin superfamily) [Saonia flava]|uniref:Mannose-6-phosphate isomerase-like protein (Cupin superfamily) n=1 Tax=Saonia flava TaxID=523696 RepID=A0A846QY08_9FLAO|nr:cupin domain-containing protein [Saonia flava]NJB71512.1 mannose-6-phosphate isomerase-like protein (cupin superfamily) [Saonia flava]
MSTKVKLFEYIQNIEGESTAHLSGLKKVFLKNTDTNSKLTQFAHGLFMPGEVCELHAHPTMDELFYFINGTGIYKVNDEEIKLKPGTFIRIPAKSQHELVNNGKNNLEFVYFGIALD